nr:S adenosylmethionine mitochondrial carrier [Hymenolepis microstoma]
MFPHEKIAPLLSGATAGLCVDLALYPLDTIKTRLQSMAHSVKPTGGFHLFAGLPAVLFGSAPSAALFFCAYEMTKNRTSSENFPRWFPPMIAACVGEICACVIRVPCETIKQRAQAHPHLGIVGIFSNALRSEGLAGLYRGYLSTIFRELPFSLIQYPIWEALKFSMQRYNQLRNCGVGDGELSKGQFALCGALAGAFAGACTTPLDVIKTRIMLADRQSAYSTSNVFTVMRLIYVESGIRGYCFFSYYCPLFAKAF